jgi:hypothetical protein
MSESAQVSSVIAMSSKEECHQVLKHFNLGRGGYLIEISRCIFEMG